MRIRITLILSVLLLSGVSAFAQEISLLQTGMFHEEEVSAKDGELWLGLFERGDTHLLLPSILSIENAYDAIVDSDGDASGKSVKVPGLGTPLFLIKGEGFIQAREVKTIRLTGRDIDSGFDETFDFNGAKYSLSVQSPNKKEDGFVADESKLVYSEGGVEQVLYYVDACSFCRWSVTWAGDLDSDGKPDFILYLTDHYNVANQKLFLSSKAENGKLVKEVAELITTGC